MSMSSMTSQSIWGICHIFVTKLKFAELYNIFGVCPRGEGGGSGESRPVNGHQAGLSCSRFSVDVKIIWKLNRAV